jgi:hypothetical protein
MAVRLSRFQTWVMMRIILKDSAWRYHCEKYNNMSTKTKRKSTKTKSDLDFISNAENLLIEKEKRYQRIVRGPQVEKLTMLKESKKRGKRK